jgi:hypothetical protein
VERGEGAFVSTAMSVRLQSYRRTQHKSGVSSVRGKGDRLGPHGVLYGVLALLTICFTATNGQGDISSMSGNVTIVEALAAISRQADPSPYVRITPASLLKKAHGESWPESPVATASSGDGFAFVLSQASNENDELSILLHKVDVNNRRIQWTLNVGDLGTPIDVCVGSNSGGSERDTLYFGKAKTANYDKMTRVSQF